MPTTDDELMPHLMRGDCVLVKKHVTYHSADKLFKPPKDFENRYIAEVFTCGLGEIHAHMRHFPSATEDDTIRIRAWREITELRAELKLWLETNRDKWCPEPEEYMRIWLNAWREPNRIGHHSDLLWLR